MKPARMNDWEIRELEHEHWLESVGLVAPSAAPSHKRKRASRLRQPNPHLLRTPQAANYLNLSPWKLRQLVYAGQIAVIKGKYWLFDTNELSRWIKGHQERETL